MHSITESVLFWNFLSLFIKIGKTRAIIFREASRGTSLALSARLLPYGTKKPNGFKENLMNYFFGVGFFFSISSIYRLHSHAKIEEKDDLPMKESQ